MDTEKSYIKNPSRISRISLLIWAGTTIAWACHLYDYYFDFKVQDAVALAMVLVTSGLIAHKMAWKAPFLPWPLLLLLGILFASWSLLEWLVLHTNQGWTFVYGLMVGSGLLIGSLWEESHRFSLLGFTSVLIWTIPFPEQEFQKLYYDKLTEVQKTRNGEVHLVQWQEHEWLYYNRKLSVTSIDAHMYYEPMVHPAMHLLEPASSVLLLGGDNGYALRELQKYEDASLTIVPFDRELHAKQSGLGHSITRQEEIFDFLTNNGDKFDLIIIDLPDPVNPMTNQYYTKEFYQECRRRLSSDGMLVTQAGSPYIGAENFQTIKRTIEAAGFGTIPMHNQVPSIGQWGWVLGVVSEAPPLVKGRLLEAKSQVPTVWWDQQATAMILSFGKAEYFDSNKGGINTMEDPVILTQTRRSR